MTRPIPNVLRRPRIVPIFPPVIISAAMTSVYIVMAVWMPVIDVPKSDATVGIDTFMTEVSRVMRNWPDASTPRTRAEPLTAPLDTVVPPDDMSLIMSANRGPTHVVGQRCRQQF